MAQNKSKAKGNRFERELVQNIELTGREAKRAWGSNGEALGMHAEVDLIFSELDGTAMAGWLQTYKVQAKIRKNIAKFLKPSENVDMQVIREDRGDIYAILKLDKLLEIIQ
ncbi:hypothetical protein CL621_01060 [archaeon]|nr:hypothetical protein [archaeon]|tara:strand:- start:3175 stop:3507 length:333 start_codon:yes stop_codon:yes gene_type:complete